MRINLRYVFKKYDVVRGMTSYAILWPTANIIEQTFVEQRETYDWKRCIRFSLFGALFFAPLLFVYVKMSSKMWPVINFRSSLSKTMVEFAFIDPLVITSFLAGMPLLEGRTCPEAVAEVKRKFFSTYKVSLMIWPPIQIINYLYVPVGYQVVMVSVVSFFWSVFLAAVHAS